MGKRTKNFTPVLGAEVKEDVRATESEFGSGRTVFYQVVILSPNSKTTWFYYKNKEQAQATVNSINEFVNNPKESFLKIN